MTRPPRDPTPEETVAQRDLSRARALADDVERAARLIARLEAQATAHDAAPIATFGGDEPPTLRATRSFLAALALDATGAQRPLQWSEVLDEADVERVAHARLVADGEPVRVAVSLRTATGEHVPGEARVQTADTSGRVAGVLLVGAPPTTPARALLHAVEDACDARPAQLERAGETLARASSFATIASVLEGAREAGLGSLTYARGIDGRHEFQAGSLVEERDGTRAVTCHVTLGFLRAALTEALGVRVVGAELRCRSRADEQHRFVFIERRHPRHARSVQNEWLRADPGWVAAKPD